VNRCGWRWLIAKCAIPILAPPAKQ